jgi:exosome complex exonuclease DIS3/RRP44
VLVAVSDDEVTRQYLKSALGGGEETSLLLASGLLQVLSTEEWITQSQPHLLDLVALATTQNEEGGNSEDGAGRRDSKGGSSSSASFLPYKEHLSSQDIERKVKLGQVFQGKLSCSSRFSPWNAVVTVRNKETFETTMEVKLAGRASLNRAMDGDVVAVELIEKNVAEQDAKDTHQPLEGVGIASVAERDEIDDEIKDSVKYARVVGIVRRSWSEKGYCGSIQPKSLPNADQLLQGQGRAFNVLFQPANRRLPLIRIRTRQANVLKDQRIVCVIDSWDRDSAYPKGHYVRALGMIGERETETKVILHQHDVTDPEEGFSPAVHACVPELPWSVPATIEDTWRRDIRSMCVFSVDPPGCKDIDDALSARFISASELSDAAVDVTAVSLANANKLVELGVHIADVTHFLKANTPMDLEASKRCTSVYLVDRRIDMLPKPLTEDICSLRSGVDRFAFSVLWRINVDTAEVVGEPEFFKSVIHSKAALTYQQAQEKIDKGGDDIITTSLLLLRKITRQLRQKRVDLGALTLASPEVKFEIDRETSNPLDVGMYVTRETNKVVEEMMLLANETVATCIFEKGFKRSAVLRRHPVPTRTMFEPLMKACKAAGIEMDVTTSKTLADSLDRAGVEVKDSYLNTLIRFMATRCMTQAEYFSSGDVAQSQFSHYGLAMPIYTHFTSPIRRYADVLVHRMLSACIGIEAPNIQLCESALVTEQCEVLNVRHRNAQMAGRASAELYTLVFFRDRPSTDRARVVKVRDNGVIVFIPKYGIEGPIKLEGWTKCGEKPQITSADGAKTLKLFDNVKVKIVVEQEGQSRQEHLVLSIV